MDNIKSRNRRDFIKKSMFAFTALNMGTDLNISENNHSLPYNYSAFKDLSGDKDLKKIAFIANVYQNSSHADVIGTKLFLGIPTDDGMVVPEVKIVSMWIDQTNSKDKKGNTLTGSLPDDGGTLIGTYDTGVKIAERNGAALYPTIAEALCRGKEKLDVDAVVFIGEQGDYSFNRLGQRMYPRMNYLDQIFRVFDAAGRSVPVFSDKALSYSWLDSKWIYDRAQELNVPMMAGSSLPYCWRDPALEHPLESKITEAVAIGFASLDAYGFHVAEILQCMVERRAGGETGVASVEGLQGKDVWNAIDAEKISLKLVNAACDRIKGKATGSMRALVKNPAAIVIRYNDGTKGAILMLDEYVNEGWAYSAYANEKLVATEFVLEHSPIYAHFSYLTLNIQKFLITGNPPAPIERNLLTSGITDMGIRSLYEKRIKETPFLKISYNVRDYDPIRPTRPRPMVQNLGLWPPKGYEFIIPEEFRKEK